MMKMMTPKCPLCKHPVYSQQEQQFPVYLHTISTLYNIDPLGVLPRLWNLLWHRKEEENVFSKFLKKVDEINFKIN